MKKKRIQQECVQDFERKRHLKGGDRQESPLSLFV